MTDPVHRRRALVAATADEAAALCDLLSVWGCDVRATADAAAVVELAAAFRPGVALLNLRLVGPDGCEAARHLRASPDLAGVTLIALAGPADADHTRIRAGVFDHVLALPVDPEELRRIVVG